MPVFVTVIAFVAFVVLHWLNIMPKVRAVAALAAGTGITAGVIGRVMRAGAAWLTHLAGTATAVLLGAAIPAALAIALLIIFVHDMHPRRKASRRTALIGFALPVLLSTAGITALASIPGGISSTVTNTVHSVQNSSVRSGG